MTYDELTALAEQLEAAGDPRAEGLRWAVAAYRAPDESRSFGREGWRLVWWSSRSWAASPDRGDLPPALFDLVARRLEGPSSLASGGAWVVCANETAAWFALADAFAALPCLGQKRAWEGAPRAAAAAMAREMAS
jgi:hypothetical protein